MLLRAVLLLLCFWSSVAFAQNTGANGEQKCQNLGADCRCSETLDFDSGGFLPTGNYNPPNSITNQCNGGSSIIILDSAADSVSTELASSRPGLGLPGGHFVLKKLFGGGGGVSHDRDQDLDITGKTYCMRAYHRLSDSLTRGPRSGSEDLKGIVSIGGGTSVSARMEFTTSDTISCEQYANNARWDFSPRRMDLVAGSQSFNNITGCAADGWCRLEMCVDHNWDGNNKLRIRCQMKQLSTQNVMTWSGDSGNAQATALLGSGQNRIIRGSGPDYVTGAAANRWWSYAMAAMKDPADPSFWIGAAEEVTTDLEGIGVNCLNNGPVDEGVGFNVIASPISHGTVDTNAYRFECQEGQGLGTCTAVGGSIVQCSADNCVCACPAINTDGTYTLGCASDESPSSGPYASSSLLVVNDTTAPTWNISQITVDPISCNAGSCSTPIDISASVSGTATGTGTWEKDCGLGAGWESIVACNDQLTCMDTCDFSGQPVSEYTVEMRATNSEGPTSSSDSELFFVVPAISVTSGGSTAGGSL